MSIFLETSFDAILKIENKDYFCESNTPLKISEITENFFIYCFPKSIYSIPFSFVVKPFEETICSHTNVKTYKLNKNDYYVRIFKQNNDLNGKNIKLSNDLYIVERDDNISVFNNNGNVLLSTEYESYKISNKNSLLYIFKNYSNLIGCELVEIYSFANGIIELKKSECVCKKSPNTDSPSRELLPYIFFEACKAHYFTFAKTLLASDFSAKVENLNSFFKPFKSIRKNEFSNKGYILFPINVSDNIVFVNFVFNKDNKIDNIVEIL